MNSKVGKDLTIQLDTSGRKTLHNEVDLLYHEATFLEAHQNLAKTTKHSTAAEAAQIAKKAKVKHLLLGHFSSRYADKQDFLKEACPIYEPVSLAEDGKEMNI